jgi:hypothetical protein
MSASSEIKNAHAAYSLALQMVSIPSGPKTSRKNWKFTISIDGVKITAYCNGICAFSSAEKSFKKFVALNFTSAILNNTIIITLSK